MRIFIPIALEISIHFIPESGIHIPGIDIHIKSERLFTSSGICSQNVALHKKSGTATRLDLKSAIANRQVRNKDVQYPQQLLWLIAPGC